MHLSFARVTMNRAYILRAALLLLVVYVIACVASVYLRDDYDWHRTYRPAALARVLGQSRSAYRLSSRRRGASSR